MYSLKGIKGVSKRSVVTSILFSTLSFMLLLSLQTMAFASSYFVSPTGSNSNNGSQSFPFKTINHALTQMASGDNLNVMAGTYQECIYKPIPNGQNANSHTLLAAYPDGASVVLKPTNYAPCTANTVFFFQPTNENITIKGLELDGSGYNSSKGYGNTGIHIEGSQNISIENSNIHDFKIAGVETNVDSNDTSGIVLSHNSINNNFTGVFVSSSHVTVSFCDIAGNANTGIDIGNFSSDAPILNISSVNIEGNFIRDNSKSNSTGEITLFNNAGDVTTGTNIRDNVIFSNGLGINIYGWNNNTTIENNSLTYFNNYAVYVAEVANHTLIQHNLFHGTNRPGDVNNQAGNKTTVGPNY